MNDRGLFLGSVIVSKLTPGGDLEAQASAGGVSHHLVRGREGGAVVEQRFELRCVSDWIHPYREWPRFLAAARLDPLRFVVSNSTEAGIAWRACPAPDRCPESFPAQLAALLLERHRACSGDPRRGLVVLPCELVPDNGAQLRELVLRHAREWGADPRARAWIEAHCRFVDTLVDRIVTRPDFEVARRVAAEIGREDPLLTCSEPFHQWVLQTSADLEQELPLQRAGFEVVYTEDLGPYRERKVRILNGSHTALVFTALPLGFDTVGAALADRRVAEFLQRLLLKEILPTLDLPDRELRDYAARTLERLHNPFLHHGLLDIALNSCAKMRTRIVPALVDMTRDTGKPPPGLTLVLAAFLRCCRTVDEIDGVAHGRFGCRTLPLTDTAADLQRIQAFWENAEGTAGLRQATLDLLRDRDFWGDDLARVAGLADALGEALAAIAREGLAAAMARLGSPPE